MAQITINFLNVTLSSTKTSIQLTGGSFALEAADGVSISGALAFSAMYITTGAMSFTVTTGSTIDAAVQATVTSSAPDASPMIEVTDFSGTVTVVWPTASGMRTQTLESGSALALSGYVG